MYSIYDDLVQHCSNSIANALELLQSCTKSLIYTYQYDLTPYNRIYVHFGNKVTFMEP